MSDWIDPNGFDDDVKWALRRVKTMTEFKQYRRST